MAKFDITDAKTRLSELVHKAMLGEEVIISKDNKPILKLVPLDKPKQPRKPGSGKEQILDIAADFDATPRGFKGFV